MNRTQPLSAAILEHVQPGMHLHFASTPSRSNAAVRELARRFLGMRPGFVFSATGFHSSLHTLGLLGLGRKYIGCFFGDNYPAPRPNPLYQDLVDQSVELEHWSLLSYVIALRAGALGHPYGVTTSLSGTGLGVALARAGRFFEVADPAGRAEPLGLVAPIVPDVTFLHAPLGTPGGRVLFTAPYGEGFHAALSARRGVIVTVEKLTDEDSLAESSHLVPLPRERVLAIAEEPFGAHPQPLHVAERTPRAAGYRDDFAAYELWREMAEDPLLFAEYRRRVLEAPDGAAAYREFVGEARLKALSVAAGRRSRPRPALPSLGAGRAPRSKLETAERLVLVAARVVARHLTEGSHRSLLAGIGQAFSASRLALLLLGPAACAVELLVETGITGFDPLTAHPFLLSADNVAAAGRLSSVEDNLGALACGGGNRCLAVVGCAEADALGNVNSSVAGGRLLVGSGGANDLCSSAREVVVLCRHERLVERVEFVTSPGKRVLTIVTDQAVLERSSVAAPWQLSGVGLGARPAAEILASLPFAARLQQDNAFDAVPSALELSLLEAVSGEATRRRTPETVSTHA